MLELQKGVWHWTATHPDWKPGQERPLLELPVEVVLPTHGAPADRAALERALSDTTSH